MRSCIKIFVIAMIPVLFAGGVQAAEKKKKSLEDLKKELESAIVNYESLDYGNIFNAYAIMKDGIEALSKKLKDIADKKKINADDFNQLIEFFNRAIGSLGGNVAISASSNIVGFWEGCKELKLELTSGEGVEIQYFTDGGGVLCEKGPMCFEEKRVKTYGELGSLWNAMCLAEQKGNFIKNNNMPTYIQEFFDFLPNVDFNILMEKVYKNNETKLLEAKQSCDEIFKKREQLKQQIVELEKAEAASINNLASTLKLIA